ncbi:MAG TPA: mycothiol synthase [Galbitalea sp.]|jgi:mycothiol synthase|nr:mycothiol synthase [Galbitalea sp.]
MSASPRSVPDRRPEALEEWVSELARRARESDGAPPFSDQALVDYRLGKRDLVAIERDAAALVTEVEAEFVVNPDARGRGLGTRMLEDLLSRGINVFWAHGDHPAARALARKYGLRADRELLHLVGPVPELVEGRAPSNGPSTSSWTEVFEVGQDEDEWVALNARTFATHPEQGKVTKQDLEQLEGEDWFSADDFLVLRQNGRMIGYCWLKVEGSRGEFYVVGVDPGHQGEHLGATLFDAGLARLASRGIRHAHLYVEADNAPAIALYRSRGFSQDSIDIQYSG